MNFTDNKSIYLQISDWVFEQILTLKWTIGERAMSVRELGVTLEVNPNTVLHAYDYLQSLEIIINKRGVGYFVAPDAIDKITAHRRSEFIEEELPVVFKNMELIGIQLKDLEKYYEEWQKKTIK